MADVTVTTTPCACCDATPNWCAFCDFDLIGNAVYASTYCADCPGEGGGFTAAERINPTGWNQVNLFGSISFSCSGDNFGTIGAGDWFFTYFHGLTANAVTCDDDPADPVVNFAVTLPVASSQVCSGGGSGGTCTVTVVDIHPLGACAAAEIGTATLKLTVNSSGSWNGVYTAAYDSGNDWWQFTMPSGATRTFYLEKGFFWCRDSASGGDHVCNYMQCGPFLAQMPTVTHAPTFGWGTGVVSNIDLEVL